MWNIVSEDDEKEKDDRSYEMVLATAMTFAVMGSAYALSNGKDLLAQWKLLKP